MRWHFFTLTKWYNDYSDLRQELPDIKWKHSHPHQNVWPTSFSFQSIERGTDNPQVLQHRFSDTSGPSKPGRIKPMRCNNLELFGCISDTHWKLARMKKSFSSYIYIYLYAISVINPWPLHLEKRLVCSSGKCITSFVDPWNYPQLMPFFTMLFIFFFYHLVFY